MGLEEITFEDILDTFEFFDSWEDRYRYIIELGRKLDPLDPSEQTEENKVRGCTSQVWLISEGLRDGGLFLRGDSDSHIVKGLVAILLTLFNGKTPQEAVQTDVQHIFEELKLEGHLSPSRSNGFFSMVKRIQALAKDQLQ